MEFKNLVDFYIGRKFIIVGCGTSALNLKGLDLSNIITIGVNDSGGVINPDYLLVVDFVTQFSDDRIKTISDTKCKTFITSNDGWDNIMKHVDKCKIYLGDLALSHMDKQKYPDKIDYSNTSTYMAAVIAYKLGAAKIGIIGLDFTANHYNNNDGIHKLISQYNQLENIRNSYKLLTERLSEYGVEFYNLSDISMIDTIPKMNLSKFIND